MRRAFVACVFLLLSTLAAGGLSTGPTPARGPDSTMSSDLVVDGARALVSPQAHRRTLAVVKPGRGDGNPRTRTFDVARTAAEVEELRPVWERLQGSRLTSDLDVFLACVRHTPGVVRPHVVLLEDEGEPTALVVAQLEESEVPARLGYRTLFAPTMRTLKVVYGGILGPTDAEGTRAALAALHASLEDEEIELVRIRALERGSPVHVAVTEEAPVLRRELFGRPTPHWRADVGCSYEEFLARRKKKVRWQARRDATRLEETYGDELEVRVFRSRDELPQLFADTATVHAKTYQNALGVGFSSERLNRRLTEVAMERGWFRGYVLYLRGKPVAFWHGNAYRGVFGLGPTGFDPEHADERPGGYLLMRAIEDLCADEEVHTLDFGFGDGTYKRQLGDECRLEEDVVIFASSPRAVSVNLVRNALQGTTTAARTVLERNGRLDGVKRAWRDRLRRSA